MHAPKRLVAAASTCLLAVALSACDLFSPDSKDTDSIACGAGAAEACADTSTWSSEGESGLRIRTWMPEGRVLWDIFLDSEGRLLYQKTYRHVYDSKFRDSVLVQYESLGGGSGSDTIVSREIRLFYGENRKRVREDHFDGQGRLEKRIHFDADGKQKDLEVLRCDLFGPYPCTKKDINVGQYGDTLTRVRSWDPGQRSLWVLQYYDDSILNFDESFKHYYNTNWKDSIVYWPVHAQPSDTTYKGWATYHYNSSGNLVRQDLFNSDEPQEPYGFRRYDGLGNLIEEMEDGFAQVYNDKGLQIKRYSIGESDSTFSVYDGLDRLVIEATTRNDDTLRRYAWEYWDTTRIRKREVEADSLRKNVRHYSRENRMLYWERFDADSTLIRKVLKDSQERDSVIEVYAPPELDTLIHYTYFEGLWNRRYTTYTDGQGDTLKVWRHNEIGQIVAVREGSSFEAPCAEPYSYSACRREESAFGG